jgi:hypothetical protein
MSPPYLKTMRYLTTFLVLPLILTSCSYGPPAEPVHTPPLDTKKAQAQAYAHYPDPNAPVYDHGYDRLNRSEPVGGLMGSSAGLYVGIGGGVGKREVRSGQDYRGPEQLDYGGRLP